MFKKISATLVATVFAFGTMFNMKSITKNFVSSCSSFCSCHNGDGWDN